MFVQWCWVKAESWLNHINCTSFLMIDDRTAFASINTCNWVNEIQKLHRRNVERERQFRMVGHMHVMHWTLFSECLSAAHPFAVDWMSVRACMNWHASMGLFVKLCAVWMRLRWAVEWGNVIACNENVEKWHFHPFIYGIERNSLVWSLTRLNATLILFRFFFSPLIYQMSKFPVAVITPNKMPDRWTR